MKMLSAAAAFSSVNFSNTVLFSARLQPVARHCTLHWRHAPGGVNHMPANALRGLVEKYMNNFPNHTAILTDASKRNKEFFWHLFHGL